MPYCEPCNYYFHNDYVYRNHRINSSKHNYCANCNMDFVSRAALKYHRIHSPLHNYCDWCKKDFGTADGLEEHDDIFHYRCDTCNDVFCCEDDLYEHIKNCHWYCSLCIEQLGNSDIHHFEAGTCPWPYCPNRTQSTKLVVQADHYNSIYNSLTTNPDSQSRLQGVASTGTRGKTVGPAVSSITWATERSYN